MRQFGGSEPLVGEIVGLRTFRIDDSGLLLPLYSSGVWYDGTNTATCSPPTGRHDGGPHAVPADECECGFYAYGSVEAARQNRNLRYVRAVVSCWGAVVAGTQGVRAEHARIAALWINPEAPSWLRKRVATRYPSARLYADADAMLAEHPLTELGCYERLAPRPVAALVLPVVAVAAVLALGALPLHILRSFDVLRDAWLVVTAAVGALAVWLLVGVRKAGHLAASFVVAGLFGWLLAPWCGALGWLLRVPLLRGLVVAAGGYLLALRPHHFPVVKTPRETPYSWVRA